MGEPAQLDIFIPLQRRERFREWALLAREHDFDLAEPGHQPAFADWLRSNGHAPPAFSQEALTVLVAVMHEYEEPASAPALPAR